MHYALAPWSTARDDAGEAVMVSPAGAATVGVIDLGARTGTAFGLFASRDPVPGRDTLALGDDLGAQPDRAALATLLKLGEPIVATSLVDVIWELLTVAADPTGVERVRPLRPTARGRIELHFGGESIVRPFRAGLDPEWPTIQAAIQEDVKRARLVDLARGDATYLKYLATLETKFQRPYTDFLAAGVPDEGTVPPETTITDDFSGGVGNFTAHTGGLTAVSATARSTPTDGTTTYAENTTPLSTDDHYAQAAGTVVHASTTQTRNVGALARMQLNGANVEGYWGRLDTTSVPDEKCQMQKRVAGVTTTMIAATAITYVAGRIVKVQADGSNISLWYHGSQVGTTQTDTDLSAIFGHGISLRWPSTGTQAQAIADDYEAADLNVQPPRSMHQFRLRRAA